MKRQVILDEADLRGAIEVYLVQKGVVQSRSQVRGATIRTGPEWTAEVEYDDAPPPPKPPESPKQPEEPPKTWHERLDEDDPKKPV